MLRLKLWGFYDPKIFNVLSTRVIHIGSSYSEQQIDSADMRLYKTVQSFVKGAFHKSTSNLYYSYKTLVNLLENTSYYSLNLISLLQ